MLGRSRQTPVANFRAHHRETHPVLQPKSPDTAIFCHLPKVSQIIQRPKHQKSVRDQFDGRTNVERYHPILRVRRRAPKGPMLEHLVQEAGREPMYYILQLYAKGRVASASQAGRIVFLSIAEWSRSIKPRVSRFSPRANAPHGRFWSNNPWYRRTDSQRRYKFWFPPQQWDLPVIGRMEDLGIWVWLSIWSHDDRFDLFRIEQELGTQIQPIPSVIDRNLYCK